VKADGDTVVQRPGIVSDRDMRKIQAFIKERYREMYLFWRNYGGQDYYRGE
jgi:hypothetical protein